MSSDSPSSPDPNQPQPGNPPPAAPTQQYQPLQPTQQFPAQSANGQPQNPPYPMQPQNAPTQNQPYSAAPQQPSGEDGKRYGIVAGIAVATAVLTIGIVFAILALTGGDGDDAAAPSQSAAPTAPASPAGTASPAATTPAATTAAATTAPATTAPGKTFPQGYAVSKGDAFGFQQPSGWVVKTDSNSAFYPDAPIIEAAQTNVEFWSDPANHPAEPGFSVTDLSRTPTTPADFINKVSQTTQRAVCANVAGYATSFSRGDWVGLRLDSGLCSDTKGETTLISATRQSDNAKIALLIRGPAPTTAVFNQAMNAFDSYRS